MVNPTNPKHHNHMTSITFDSFITAQGFDTLALSKIFKSVNFSEDQAEVMAETIVKASSSIGNKIEIFEEKNSKNLNELCTKGDLLITRKELELQIEQVALQIEQVRLKIEQVRSELLAEIANTKSDLIKWVAGLMIANTGLLFTLIKFFN